MSTTAEVKVGEDRSRTGVESKGFADCQVLMEQLTVCTDGDHPPFPSCPAILSRFLAVAAGSIHLLYSAGQGPNLHSLAPSNVRPSHEPETTFTLF